MKGATVAIKTGVYIILNNVNCKIYVGSAAQKGGIIRRKNDHLSKLNTQTHPNIHLQRAYNKHGKDAFVFLSLEYCEPSMCISREQWWLDFINPEYNISRTAGSNLGFKHTDETKQQMSKDRADPSPEVRRKISEGNIGKIRSPEMRKRYSKMWTNPEIRKKHNSIKLSKTEVIEILRLWKELSPRKGLKALLGRVFNVHSATIHDIVTGRTWKDLALLKE